jgi:putative peptidoglycan lipid II flippase
MVKLLRRTLTIFTRQQNNILAASTVIMTAVLLSRVLGLVRDRMLAARFTPDELGIYYAAFRLPNLIFELLVMGALATAFIPVFTAHLDTKGKEEAFRMASSIINIGTVIFCLFAIPMVIFSKPISILLAPGFHGVQIDLMSTFTQIMIVAQVFPLIAGNFLTGMLQSFRNFLVPSLAPVVYNLGIIIGIIVLTPFVGLYAPVFGVVLGAVLFTVIQIPPIISFGYRHTWNIFPVHPGTREVGRLMLPRTLGLAVSQIDSTIDLTLSTLLGAGAVTVFNFAQHLQMVPVGLFGASIAQATLPTLSSYHAKKDYEEFKAIFLSSFHQILFFVIPLSVLLIVLRIPMVRLVFGASALFDWNSTVMTGQTLAFFSISLFAQALVHLLARAFFALHDTKTPVVVSAVSVLLNIIFSLLFILVYHMPVWSLGLSTSIANIVNIALLMYFMNKKVGGFHLTELLFPSLKIFLAGAVSGVALYIPIKLLDQLVFDTTRTINLIALTGVSTLAGFSVYFFLAWFLDVPQVVVLTKLFKRAKEFRKGMVIDTSSEVVNS